MKENNSRTQLHRTTDHEEIRRWIEERRGQPAQVKGTSGGEDENEPGVLEVAFPEARSKNSIEELSWDQFFEKFDRAHLVFEYASAGIGGANDYKFVPAEGR
jgi:hypothetical protein